MWGARASPDAATSTKKPDGIPLVRARYVPLGSHAESTPKKKKRSDLAHHAVAYPARAPAPVETRDTAESRPIAR